MTVLNTLQGSVSLTTSWTPASINAPVGSDYSATANSSNINKIITFQAPSPTPSSVGGADIVASFITTINASSSATIDLTNFVDVVQTTVTSMVRVKSIMVRNLSTTDDPVYGQDSTSIVFGNDGGSTTNLFQGFMRTTGDSIRVYNGGVYYCAVGNAAGVPVSGSEKLVVFTNEDSSNQAAVQLTFFGGSS